MLLTTHLTRMVIGEFLDDFGLFLLVLRYTSMMLLVAIDENHHSTYDFLYLPIEFMVYTSYISFLLRLGIFHPRMTLWVMLLSTRCLLHTLSTQYQVM